MFWFGIKDKLKILENLTNNNSIEIKNNSKEVLELHKLLRNLTIQNTISRSLNSLQKKVLKKLDVVELQKAIYNFIRSGYKTNHMKEEIKLMFNISNTCFYKYLKIVREQLKEEVHNEVIKNGNL